MPHPAIHSTGLSRGRQTPLRRFKGSEDYTAMRSPATHYAHREFVPLVRRDFSAMRRRDAKNINALLAHWSWRTYNAYLKGNRIASGIENYDQVTRLMLGVPLDNRGLPEHLPREQAVDSPAPRTGRLVMRTLLRPSPFGGFLLSTFPRVLWASVYFPRSPARGRYSRMHRGGST